MNTGDKIACCMICTLADAMKDCQGCPFNPYRLKASPSKDEVRNVTKNTQFMTFAAGYLKNIKNGSR